MSKCIKFYYTKPGHANPLHPLWDDATTKTLHALVGKGNEPGWLGYYIPVDVQADDIPYFVPGATTVKEAVAGGMPRNVAKDGWVTTPAKLLC